MFKVYENESYKSQNECHAWVNIECHVLKSLKYKLQKMTKIKYNCTNYVHSPNCRPFHHKSNSRLYPFNTNS